MLISEVIIPQMFTAYANDMRYLDNGLHQFQYFCKECDQAFGAAWGRIPGSIGGYERGARFYCPYCGTLHEKYVVVVDHGVRAPNKIRLTVKAYEKLVVLEVSCDTVSFLDLFKVIVSRYKETFRFDTAKQTVTFSRFDSTDDEIESMEIGNPFNINVLEKSILGFFLPASLANLKQKSELNKLIKILREAVHTRLEKHLGHEIKSMYVSPGQYHGMFLLPLLNIAYRVNFPDAPNLPTIYRQSIRTIKGYWDMQMFKDVEFADSAIPRIKQKSDYITALAEAASLPDKSAVRRIIGESIFEIGKLIIAFDLCKNYDYAIRLYHGLKMIMAEMRYSPSDLVQFLKTMLPIYGEQGIVKMIEASKDIELADCIALYRQLSDENRQPILRGEIKLNELHDWMAKMHQRQTHKNLKFDFPAHIVRRLSMQTNRLKFFLPRESIELLEAGVELHNCVASYGSAMKDNSKWVVLVTDEKGKLVACLEVRGKELVQAKIDRNKPVANDTKLNDEVIAWAREAGLEIRTNDVKVQEEDPTMIAAVG